MTTAHLTCIPVRQAAPPFKKKKTSLVSEPTVNLLVRCVRNQRKMCNPEITQEIVNEFVVEGLQQEYKPLAEFSFLVLFSSIPTYSMLEEY